MAPPALHLRENTRSRRQGRRHDPLGRTLGGLDQQRANGSQDNADDDDEEMIVAVMLCLCMMAAATTAVAAAVTGLQQTRREVPGDYRRPNLSYLHNHAEGVSLFKRKYRMERTSFNKLVRLLTPYLERTSISQVCLSRRWDNQLLPIEIHVILCGLRSTRRPTPAALLVQNCLFYVKQRHSLAKPTPVQ